MAFYQAGILSNQEDVLDRLLQLEEELRDLKLRQKVRIIIFGGTALLLYTDYRVTSDIDCYLMEKDIVSQVMGVLETYGVNNRLEAVMEFPPPEDFIDRSKVFYTSEILEVRLASKEDLVLSKLFSSRGAEQDYLDLVESSLLDQVDLEYIKKMYEEYCTYYVGSKVNISRLDDILKERERYKKGKVSKEV